MKKEIVFRDLDEVIINDKLNLEKIFEDFSAIQLWEFINRLNIYYIEKYMN